jgi:hypothetical protein
MVNDAAVAYMRQRALAGPTIALLAEHPDKQFADTTAWTAHLERLGITKLTVTPDPVQIATEGALWGSVQSHEFLRDAVIVSDGACPCEGARGFSHLVSASFRAAARDGSGRTAPCRGGR